MKGIKLILCGAMCVPSLFNPLNVLALDSTESSVPLKASVQPTPIDVTTNDKIEISANKGSVDLSISDMLITNNSNVGVIEVSEMKVVPVDNWELIDKTTDFNKLSIDSQKFSITYGENDLITPIRNKQKVNPNENVNLHFEGKTNVSSTTLNKKIADTLLTLKYVEDGNELIPILRQRLGEYTEKTKKIEFVQGDVETNTSIAQIDVSMKSDKSIIANVFSDETETDKYNVIISSKGIIQAPENCSTMFSGGESDRYGPNFTQLKEIKFDNFDTRNVKIMSGMFKSYSSDIPLKDIEDWDISNVTDINSMFSEARLPSLDLSKWDVSGLTDFSAVFNDCTIPSVNLSNWNLSNVRSLSSTKFLGNITDLNLSNWKFNQVKSLSFLFNRCNAEKINVTNWDLSNVTNISSIFQDCANLKTIVGLKEWNVSNVANMTQMLFGCVSLPSIDLSYWDISNVTQMSDMLNTNKSSVGETSTGALKSVNVSNWKISEKTAISDFSFNCSLAETIDVSNWNTSCLTSTKNLFKFCKNLNTIKGLETWDVSNVRDMSLMFYQCQNISNLDGIKNWNVSNVTNMSWMLFGCVSLPSIDLSQWRVSQDLDSANMFKECPATPPSWYQESI